MCTSNLRAAISSGHDMTWPGQFPSNHIHELRTANSSMDDAGGDCSENMSAPPSIFSQPVSKMPHDHPVTSHSNNTHKTKKRVSLDERVYVRVTIACEDISPQEHNATWYSRDEYEQITQSCCKQIKKLDRGELLKDKKYCTRGLESHTRIRSLAKRMNRSLAYDAVLEEQDRQLCQGILDGDALARVYHACSSSCQIWANVVGLEDQKEASIIHDDSEETLISNR